MSKAAATNKTEVFQTLTVSARTEPDPKTGHVRTVSVGQVNCSHTRCSKVDYSCRQCIIEASQHKDTLLEQFLEMEKMENAGAHHLQGGYQIPVVH